MAMITGASMGLGAEFARLFAADGHGLVLVARSRDKLEALAAELARPGLRVEVVVADLIDPDAPARVVEALDGLGIQPDFLVNNAGFGSHGLFHEIDLGRELDMIQVSVKALVHLTGLVLPGMIARKRGRILNLASTTSFQPGPLMATYYATKAFVLSFSEAVAHEVRGSGVTVTAYCPGATLTEFGNVSGNAGSKFFQMTAADPREVARGGYRALQGGRVVSVPGFANWATAQAVRISPRFLARAIAGRANRVSV